MQMMRLLPTFEEMVRSKGEEAYVANILSMGAGCEYYEVCFDKLTILKSIPFAYPLAAFTDLSFTISAVHHGRGGVLTIHPGDVPVLEGAEPKEIPIGWCTTLKMSDPIFPVITVTLMGTNNAGRNFETNLPVGRVVHDKGDQWGEGSQQLFASNGFHSFQLDYHITCSDGTTSAIGSERFRGFLATILDLDRVRGGRGSRSEGAIMSAGIRLLEEQGYELKSASGDMVVVRGPRAIEALVSAKKSRKRKNQRSSDR